MLKQWQNILHVIVNVNLIAQHVILIKNEIIKHVNVNEEIIVKTKKFIPWVLAHVFARRASVQKVLLILQWLHVMKL